MRKLIPILALLLFISPGFAAFEPDPVAYPNILCILADDLGYGDLACLGATDMKTPHIDQLASEGINFTKFYANCTVCSPSRASLLWGRFPDMVGVPGVIRQTWKTAGAIWIRQLHLSPRFSDVVATILPSSANGIWDWKVPIHPTTGALTISKVSLAT